MKNLDLAWKIADAVLHEGYLLYPYRTSAIKNRFRWQFGVVAPRSWSEQGGEPWQMRTECLIEPQGSPVVEIIVRFLHVQEQGGIERRIELGMVALDPPGIEDGSLWPRLGTKPFHIAAEGGCITGNIQVSAENLDGFIKLVVLIENLSDIPPECDRTAAMRRSLAGTHTLLTVTGGAFVSLTDPPPEARKAADACSNLHTWPVLVGAAGERQVMLSSPIILPDHPQIAPESAGDFCDATEIDELLTLRVMTLTDEEKREACAADDRAREIIQRSDSIPPEIFERLHGAVRSFKPATAEEFFNPPGEDPEHAAIESNGGRVSKGSRVRLAPHRRSDSMDMFLAGRTAIVEAVHRDVEERVYVAVRVEGDEAAGLDGRYRRSYYFYPDEIEFLEA
jgi:hypothetical protein